MNPTSAEPPRAISGLGPAILIERPAPSPRRSVTLPALMPSSAILLALSLLSGISACLAGIPEPYNLVFGIIEMDGRRVTAADTTVSVEARRIPAGAAIARYDMGSQASAGDYYALKIRLESEGVSDLMKAADAGTTLYITVLDGTRIKNQLELVVGARGSVRRLDFGNIDTDSDGLPDGWEQAYLYGLGYGPEADPDGDESPNAQEYRLGTNPLQADARHPADVNQDWRITISELSTYYGAWKKGLTWPIAPTNIPVEYVTRATYLWEQGEYYKLDTTVTNVGPLWWVKGSAPTNAPAGPPAPQPPPEEDAAPMVVTTMGPVGYRTGQEVVLTNRVVLNTKARTFALEHYPPAGWEVVSVQGGVYDRDNRRVKWGPFLDRQGRELVYTLKPGSEAAGSQVLDGLASYDGHKVMLQGAKALVALPSEPGQFMLLPAGGPQRWLLVGNPGQAYEIQTSHDLRTWTPLARATADPAGQVQIIDESTDGRRFYRACRLE